MEANYLINLSTLQDNQMEFFHHLEGRIIYIFPEKVISTILFSGHFYVLSSFV